MEYWSTEEGAEIQFHCHDGYHPNQSTTSHCLNSTWSPDPYDLVCTMANPPSKKHNLFFRHKMLFSTSVFENVLWGKLYKLCFSTCSAIVDRSVSCSVRDLSPSLVEVNRVCGSVSGGGVCYSGDSVGSVAVYFCDDGYTLDGDSTRECLSSGLWNGTTPQCVERDGKSILT